MSAEQVYPHPQSDKELGPDYFHAPHRGSENLKPKKTRNLHAVGRAAVQGEGSVSNDAYAHPFRMDVTPEEEARAIRESHEAHQEATRQAAMFLSSEARELERVALDRPSVAANRLATDMLSALPYRRVEFGNKECVEIIDDREDLIVSGTAPAIEVFRTSHEDGSQEVTITDNMIDLDHYRQLEITARPDVYGQVEVVMVEHTKRTPVDPDRQAGYIARVARHLSEIAPRLTTEDDVTARRIATARVHPRTF